METRKLNVGVSDRIEWTGQDERFGLDYSTKAGIYKDYKFDIRYDYDGDPYKKPNCGLILCIYFKGARIHSTFGRERSVETLAEQAEEYLHKDLIMYRERI